MEVTNAKNTINNFKRLLGRRFHDSYVQQEKQFNAYSIIEGNNGSVNIEVRRFSRMIEIRILFRLIILVNVNDLHLNK
jgi:molecular chaperone DnaK (HSP70)